MLQFGLGTLLSLVINTLTILGWYYGNPLVPSVVNVGLALWVLGYYGLEDQWAFPLGYWLVELAAVVLWLSGFRLAGSLQGQ